MKIATRTKLLVLVALLGVVVSVAVALFSLRVSLMQDRQNKTENLVAVALKTLAHFHEKEKAGEMSRAQAQAAAIGVIRDYR